MMEVGWRRFETVRIFDEFKRLTVLIEIRTWNKWLESK